jgi:hypothetical protein
MPCPICKELYEEIAYTENMIMQLSYIGKDTSSWEEHSYALRFSECTHQCKPPHTFLSSNGQYVWKKGVYTREDYNFVPSGLTTIPENREMDNMVGTTQLEVEHYANMCKKMMQKQCKIREKW